MYYAKVALEFMIDCKYDVVLIGNYCVISQKLSQTSYVYTLTKVDYLFCPNQTYKMAAAESKFLIGCWNNAINHL